MGPIRVPSPAAGIITITFIAACKYTRAKQGLQINGGYWLRVLQPGHRQCGDGHACPSAALKKSPLLAKDARNGAPAVSGSDIFEVRPNCCQPSFTSVAGRFEYTAWATSSLRDTASALLRSKHCR